jgi:GTPase SAR1 family protein
MHGITVPFRMLIIGASGSGKTNWLLELIHRMSGTFTNIVVCLRSKDEPLYNYLESKIKEGLEFYEVQSSTDIPNLDDLEPQTLIVFDDLISAGKDVQTKIAEYYIRARKKQVSCIYISQSYFAIPKIIRQQANYIVLKKINSSKDLTLILKEFPLDIKIEELKRIYAEASKGIEQFLLIDINKNEFRKNWEVTTKK